MTSVPVAAPPGLAELLARRIPGARIVAVVPLGPDTVADTVTAGATGKGVGHGVPLRIEVEVAGGARRTLVLHFAAPNEFGHDRRSDRAEELLLAFDTFPTIPSHVRAIDVGAVRADGALVSLADAGEFWLLTEWGRGHVYADELRRLAAGGAATADDLAHVETLARYLVGLHAQRQESVVAYRRAIRDLVGHGEGIFGLCDSYPPGVPGAPLARLSRIEEQCLAFRWRLRGREARLARTHGDFHPFNIVFDGDELRLLDASRGGHGDPADDVTCLALNFVFFALAAPDARGAWARALGPLWRTFWKTYLDGSGDRALLEVAAPFLAWRALVLASPRWYPDLSVPARDALLGFVEQALAAPRFAPEAAEALFGGAS